LATAGANGLAKVWDAATGEELLVLEGHTAGLFRVAYSPDGRVIATTSDFPDTTVKVWDAQSGEIIHSLGPNPSRAFGLAFSPDGKWVAAGGGGGFLTVWDVTTGEQVSDLTGQSSALGTTLFTPDGQRLITGGVDGVSIWDITTGTELLNLAPINSGAIALTADEQQLYMVPGLEPVVRVYSVKLADTVALAQSRLTRSWTAEECRQYLHVAVCPVQE
jgi:WD40 repeat protein